MVKRQGRGRAKGESYKRRSNAEIARDRAAESAARLAAERQQEERLRRRDARFWSSFTSCRATGDRDLIGGEIEQPPSENAETNDTPPAAAANADLDPGAGNDDNDHAHQDAAFAEDHEEVDPNDDDEEADANLNVDDTVGAGDRASAQHQNKSEKKGKVSLPDLSRVPVAFHESFVQVLKLVHEAIRRQSAKWNNHGWRHFDMAFWPFANLDKIWPDPTLLLNSPSIVDFMLPYFGRMRFFMPDRITPQLLPEGRMPCKWHGHSKPDGEHCCNRNMIFAPQGPRIVTDIDGSVLYVFSSRYRCRIREAEYRSTPRSERPDEYYYFVGHDPEVLSKLSPELRGQLGCVLTRRRGVTTQLANEICLQATSKISFTSITKRIKDKQTSQFRQRQLQYFSLVNTLRRNGSIRQPNRKFANMTIDEVMVVQPPSRNYIQNILVSRTLDLLPFYERFLQLLGGKVLRADQSYKVVRYVYTAASVEGRNQGQGSVRAFDSIYTVMNEHCLVIAIYFVRSGHHNEIERILTKIRERFELHGYDDVELFYTDNCCHEYKMLLRAFPCLGLVDKQEDATGVRRDIEMDLDPLPLPESRPSSAIKRYADLQTACNNLLGTLDDEGPPVYIGLDTEHDSETDEEKTAAKPETLQLSTPDGSWMILVKLEPTFRGCKESVEKGQRTWGDYDALKRLFSHPRVVLCGVGVVGDVNKLLGHFDEELFGDAVTLPSKIFDPNVQGRSFGMIAPGRGNGTLDTLMKRFLRHGKGENWALSKWSSPRLTVGQIEYALRDAYGSAAVSVKMAPTCIMYRKPKRAELQIGMPVRLVGSNGCDIGAYGRVAQCAARKKLLIQVHAVVRPSMLTVKEPSAVLPEGAEQPKLKDIDRNTAIYWQVPRLRMSTEEELQAQIALEAEAVRRRQERQQEVNDVLRAAGAARVAAAAPTGEATTRRAVETHVPAAGALGEDGQAQSVDDVRALETQLPAAGALGEDGQAQSAAASQGGASGDGDGATTVSVNRQNDSFDELLLSGTTMDYYPRTHRRRPAAGDDEFIMVGHDEHETVDLDGTLLEMLRNHVKSDVFHVIKMYKDSLKRTHALYLDFSGALRDAIFMVDPVHLEAEKQKLAAKLAGDPHSRYYGKLEEATCEASRRLSCPATKLLDNVPRSIPEPEVLEQRIQRVVEMFAPLVDPKSGEVLFSQETWRVHRNVLVHVRRGCLSDRPNYEYYYTVTGDNNKQVLYCVRGTSQLEGFHRHLRELFPAFHTAPLLAVCLLACFVHRWNIERMVERDLLDKKFQHDCLNQSMLKDLQALRIELGDVFGDLEFDDNRFENVDDRADTGERFYTPIVTGNVYDEEEYDEYDVFEPNQMSASMRFSSERDGSQIGQMPIQPVLPMERQDVRALLRWFTSSNNRGPNANRNQRGAIDFEAAARCWNAQCDAELAKPVLDRRKIYPKNPQLLKKFQKEDMEAQNRKRARLMQTTTQTNDDGVVETMTVDRAIGLLRRNLHTSGSGRVPAPMLGAGPTNPLPLREQPAQQHDPVPVPPMEIHNARANDVVMRDVQQNNHLQMPQPEPVRVGRVRAKYRCMRCGNEKTGNLHQGGAAANSALYCSVLPSDRHPEWPEFQGYQVGDTRPKLRAFQMKKKWAAIRTQTGIEDNVIFEGWN